MKIENVNFSGLSVFRPANGRDVEVRPNWFLLVDAKGKRPRHRLIPMNGPVRVALQRVIDSRTTGPVFDYSHAGVGASTLGVVLRKPVTEPEYRLVSRLRAV